MPFCGKCGRKLEFGELCDCEQKKTPSAAEPAEEFFSLVGKAIDEAEDTPLLEDDDMKILPEKPSISSHVRRKIDDANRLADTRPFSFGAVPLEDEEDEEEEPPLEEGRFDFLTRINWKKLTVFSVGGILLATILFVAGFLLFSGGKEVTEGLVTVTLENGTDVVITKLDGKNRSAVVKGDLAFYENNAFLTENRERVFFFAEGGSSLYYLDLTGKNWHKNDPVLIDSGFEVQIYYVSPDGSRVLFQKEENGALYAVGLTRGERVTVSSAARDVIIDENFSYLTYVGENNALYEVRLENGWQPSLVAELLENAPVFGGEGAVYYLNDNNLYEKQGGYPYQLLAEGVEELVYRNARGYSCHWSRENGLIFPENSGEEAFDGSFYYTVNAASYYPLIDFIEEESWEELDTAPVGIGDIAGIRWELKEENRYLIVTSMNNVDVTLQYAYFDDAEGAYVVTEQKGHFSTPETIAFTVAEEEGSKLYEYQIYFKSTPAGSTLVLSGEKDGLVVRGEYDSKEGSAMTSSGKAGWQKELVTSLEGKSYPFESKELYYYQNGSSVLVKSGCSRVGALNDGLLLFTAADLNEIEKLKLSEMEEITLSELLGIIEQRFTFGAESDFLALDGTACSVKEGYDPKGIFAADGQLYYYDAVTGAVLRFTLAEGTFTSPMTVAVDAAPEGYRVQDGDVVFFRNIGTETGSLFFNGARVADDVYYDSCIWPNESDVSEFYYLRSTGDGKQLWYYANTVSTLVGEKIAGTPLVLGENVLYLSGLISGSGDICFFNGTGSEKISEGSRLFLLG